MLYAILAGIVVLILIGGKLMATNAEILTNLDAIDASIKALEEAPAPTGGLTPAETQVVADRTATERDRLAKLVPPTV